MANDILNRKFSYAHFGEKLRTIGAIVVVQMLVQIFGFISGLLVIRTLSTQEYALYTLAYTMLGTMTVLSDAGISAAVLSNGGRVWDDKVKLGSVINTGIHLRKTFAKYVLVVAAPLLPYFLTKSSASWPGSILITIALIPLFLMNLSSVLLEVAPKLRQATQPLLHIQLVASVARTAFLSIFTYALPTALSAILSAAAVQVFANRSLKKLSSNFADLSGKIDPKAEEAIYSTTKRALPGAIYYCLAGQITVWLISIFGSPEGIAEIGALGRLAAILNIPGSILSVVVVPKFARLSGTAAVIRWRYLEINALLIATSATIIATAALIPSQVLWILGRQYSHLAAELVLIIAGSCLGFLAGAAYSLNCARGLICPPAFILPLVIGVQAVFLSMFSVNTVQAAAVYGVAVQIITYLCHFVYGLLFLERKT